jgi:hypothetical protein
MAVREIVQEEVPTRSWLGAGALRGDQVLAAYKWLRGGAVDPDEAFDWPDGAVWRGPHTRYGLVYAVGPAGLPFGVNDELWVVELRDPVGITPCPEQRTHGGPRMFGIRERRVIAREARLSRRVEAWTEGIAREFAAVCAHRTRERVRDGLADASRLLAEGWAPDAAEDGSSALRLVELLIGIWRDARAMDARGMEHPANVYATAAAASRSAAALTYASSGASDVEARAMADRAYAEERRWQARWLADRLGLPQTGIAAA